MGDVVPHAADRGRVAGGRGAVPAGLPVRPAAAGARHHPDLALLHRGPVRVPRGPAAVAASRIAGGFSWTGCPVRVPRGPLPWRRAAISGFVVDPDRKKLSKSLGNEADAPHALLDEFGADAIRYWAASSKLGGDTTLDRNRIRVDTAERLQALAEVEDDVRAAGAVEELVTSEGPGLTVTAALD
ncbi:MAG: class I tRNA ligase family protein [Nitriliruptorales bacterium]